MLSKCRFKKRVVVALNTLIFVSYNCAETPDTDTISAEQTGSYWGEVVRAYDPIYVGYTFDDGDEPFLDFSLSVLTPASILIPWEKWSPRNKFPDTSNYEAPNSFPYQPRLYLAFTGRAGQYIATRESSPVVGKSFNPLLAARWWHRSRNLMTGEKGALSLHDYFELSYGHQSNGQSIGDIEDPQTPEQENAGQRRYEALRNEYALNGEDPDFARDSLSRGWDYIGARWASSWEVKRGRLFVTLEGRYFLDDGLLQGKAEEYNLWENDGDWLERYDGEITRSKFDGLRARFRFHSESYKRFFNHADVANESGASDTDSNAFFDFLFDETDLSLELKTGYTKPFSYLTAKVELGFRFTSVWYRYGYNSDLVDYYHKDSSIGIAIKIRDF